MSRMRSSWTAGFPSGQRDQTVNLTALPSKVRILLPPPKHTSPERTAIRALLFLPVKKITRRLRLVTVQLANPDPLGSKPLYPKPHSHHMRHDVAASGIARRLTSTACCCKATSAHTTHTVRQADKPRQCCIREFISLYILI